MGRILAIDYGGVRTGIAVTDPLQIVASGLTTVATTNLIDFLRDYMESEQVDLVVIGLPRQMNNQPSEVEVDILQFIEKLKVVFPDLPISRIDERFTSKIASQTLLDSGLSKKKRQNKALLDEISATIILQSYLKSR
ncbi:MAG: Holliday junction resolvase RuvX [Flavobacteriaceae bacterium]|nr:Holliday junction resolvase RuvX [Bacteroidia bacterium]NNF75020.1 Holliday junction resolvase RuvX [Flavobacteriaceae bacterium]NNK73674.1 Holliday junction resolvase RuvX [Flavobacteriaceae bacterium]